MKNLLNSITDKYTIILTKFRIVSAASTVDALRKAFGDLDKVVAHNEATADYLNDEITKLAEARYSAIDEATKARVIRDRLDALLTV